MQIFAEWKDGRDKARVFNRFHAPRLRPYSSQDFAFGAKTVFFALT
jgi:hypothetical protein